MLLYCTLADVRFDFSKFNSKPTLYLTFEGVSPQIGLYTTESTWETDLEHWKGEIGKSHRLRERWDRDPRHASAEKMLRWLQLDKRDYPTRRRGYRPKERPWGTT